MRVGDPQSLNRYSYTGNDPVNYTDPTGMERAPGAGYVPGAMGALGRVSPGVGSDMGHDAYPGQHWTMPSGEGNAWATAAEAEGEVTGAAQEAQSFANSNSSCSIEVRTQGTLSPGTPEFHTGPDTVSLGSYAGDEEYGFRFEVRGSVSSGGVGFVGLSSTDPRADVVKGSLNNGGKWTVGQTVISTSVWAEYTGGLTINRNTHPGPDNPRPDIRNISGNSFSWHDAPGFIKYAGIEHTKPLVAARNTTVFRVYATDGHNSCSVNFQVNESFRRGVWRASIKQVSLK